MTNDPKIHAIVNGSTYMRNFNMNPYLYNRFATNSYLEKVTKLNIQEVFVYIQIMISEKIQIWSVTEMQT